ncbi:DUF3846 domain-containing protein [Prescottella equi]
MTATTVTGFRITPEGKGSVVELKVGPDGSHLADLREAIDCRYVDVIRLDRRLDMWIDDEGLLVEDPKDNVIASLIAQLGFLRPIGPIKGTVVLTGGADDDGDIVSVDVAHAEGMFAAASVFVPQEATAGS